MNEVSRASRRFFLGGIAVALSSGLWPTHASAQNKEFRALPKALWVWLKSLNELPNLSHFAVDHRFDALMIHFRDPSRTELLEGSTSAIRILRELKGKNCLCYALAGEPQWATQSTIPNSIAQLLEINRRHSLFDGLHLDVEPHSLPAWRQPGGRVALMRGLADFSVRMRDTLPENMKLQLAVHPKNALQTMDNQDFLERVAPHVQEIALMAYRDTPQRQQRAAKDAISRLQQLKLPWRMGVLTNPPKEPGVSYHGLQPAIFAAHMQELWSALKSAPQCRGLIFENYHSLRGLLLDRS